MHKKHVKTYCLVFFLIMIPIIAAFLLTSSKEAKYSSDTIEATTINRISDSEREFVFDVTDYKEGKNGIVFFSKHQYIEAYCHGELVYEYNENGGILGHTPGAFWNFIDIPEKGSELTIKLRAAYDSVAEDVPVFLIGNQLDIYEEIFEESVPALMVSLLILIFGSMVSIYWIFIGDKFNIGYGMMYLGLGSVIMGMFFVNDTNAMILLTDHRTVSTLVTYLTLMAISPVSILYTREYIGLIENVIWKVLCAFSLGEFIVCFALQILNIVDLRETLFLTHGMIGVTVIYLLVTLIVKVYKYEEGHLVKGTLIGLIIVCVTAIIDMKNYYSGAYASDTVPMTRIGFYICLWCIVIEAMVYFFRLMGKGLQTEIYEKLAVKDELTGLHNRNAYIADVEAMTSYNDVMVATFDLNDLKKCNDTLGHKEGDLYILSAAKFIQEVFAPYGKSYRIGGDEFCVLIKKATGCPMETLIRQLQMKELKFNEVNPQINMYISCGYAIFDADKDSDLEETRVRADLLLYEDKSRSKAKMSGETESTDKKSMESESPEVEVSEETTESLSSKGKVSEETTKSQSSDGKSPEEPTELTSSELKLPEVIPEVKSPEVKLLESKLLVEKSEELISLEETSRKIELLEMKLLESKSPEHKSLELKLAEPELIETQE